MPDITNDEFIVTGYVNSNFADDTYTTYVAPNGAEYWTFGSEPFQRWVDTDRDGYWDYGLRDAGSGHWHRFDGFQWKDANGNVVPDIREDPEGSNVTVPNPNMESEGWLF